MDALLRHDTETKQEDKSQGLISIVIITILIAFALLEATVFKGKVRSLKELIGFFLLAGFLAASGFEIFGKIANLPKKAILNFWKVWGFWIIFPASAIFCLVLLYLGWWSHLCGFSHQPPFAPGISIIIMSSAYLWLRYQGLKKAEKPGRHLGWTLATIIFTILYLWL